MQSRIETGSFYIYGKRFNGRTNDFFALNDEQRKNCFVQTTAAAIVYRVVFYNGEWKVKEVFHNIDRAPRYRFVPNGPCSYTYFFN